MNELTYVKGQGWVYVVRSAPITLECGTSVVATFRPLIKGDRYMYCRREYSDNGTPNDLTWDKLLYKCQYHTWNGDNNFPTVSTPTYKGLDGLLYFAIEPV